MTYVTFSTVRSRRWTFRVISNSRGNDRMSSHATDIVLKVRNSYQVMEVESKVAPSTMMSDSDPSILKQEPKHPKIPS